ncbi:UNVERIFIED_CONTAM: hypothetical protein IGO34_23095 [Salmonella enterica subsp. enterica serovar Weltevreden]
MAEKEFPVTVTDKDGNKRTAHSLIAYNQLLTQGYEDAEKPKRSSGGSKSTSKSTAKSAAKSTTHTNPVKDEGQDAKTGDKS